jgi:MFS family permease
MVTDCADDSSGPNILIPALVVSWGIVTTFQGFVSSYEGLLATRFFLGLTEGAILPVCLALPLEMSYD